MGNFRQPFSVTTSKVMHVNASHFSGKAVIQIKKTPLLSKGTKTKKNSKHYFLLSLTQFLHSH